MLLSRMRKIKLGQDVTVWESDPGPGESSVRK